MERQGACFGIEAETEERADVQTQRPDGQLSAVEHLAARAATLEPGQVEKIKGHLRRYSSTEEEMCRTVAEILEVGTSSLTHRP